MAILAVLGREEREILQQPGLMLGRQEFSFLCLEPGPGLGSDLAAVTPRAFFLDADLPGFSAFHLVASLRRANGWGKVPMFILSSQERSEESRTVGATGFFRKPLDVGKFMDTLAASLDARGRRFRRRPLSGPCLVAAAGRRLDAKLFDVSVTGLRVAVDGTLSLGSMVQLSFGVPLPGRNHIVRCQGKVARRIAGGYAFAFSTMETGDRALLQAFTQAAGA